MNAKKKILPCIVVMMNTAFRKLALVLVVLFHCATPMVQACGHTTVSYSQQGLGGHFSFSPAGDSSINRCTAKQRSAACEKACTMTDGILDMGCYDDCTIEYCRIKPPYW
jgi:hypothetical protein